MSTYAHAEDLDKLIWTCEHYENDGTYCYKAGDAYFAIHDYGQAKTYYEKAVAYIRDKKPDARFYVFTDSPDIFLLIFIIR